MLEIAGAPPPGLTFIDLVPMFDDAGPEELFIDNCHFGDRGNDLIAREMVATITRLIAARLGR